MSKRSPNWMFTALALLFSLGTQVFAEEQKVDKSAATLIAEAATCIYLPHFDANKPTDLFNDRELEILANHTKPLNLMIRDALGRGNSICGAYFSQLYGLKQNLDLLRYHILEPGRFYGWEGLYREDDEPHLSDDQYVYDSKYIPVAESLAGLPIHKFIVLTEFETAQILAMAEDASHESQEWAIWIGRKLGVL